MPLRIESALSEVQERYFKEIDKLAGDTILAKYPLWKQQNIHARTTELALQGITEHADLDYAKTVWDWVKQVRNASNTAKQNIQVCDTAHSAYTVMENYKELLSSL